MNVINEISFMLLRYITIVPNMYHRWCIVLLVQTIFHFNYSFELIQRPNFTPSNIKSQIKDNKTIRYLILNLIISLKVFSWENKIHFYTPKCHNILHLGVNVT